MRPPLRRLPIIFHPGYEMDFGDHVFPTDKYRLAFELLRKQGYASLEEIIEPVPATPDQILSVHTAAYWSDFKDLRLTPRTMFSELPLTQEIVDAFTLLSGGTITAARIALEKGVALHLGGGFHHAFAEHAEGFCYLNDIAIAIRVMQQESRIRRAAVIDVDLHQGNGTAHIFRDDPNVLTFSIHQEWLYPEKQESDIDIGLPNGTGDEEYLKLLGGVVPERIEPHHPELVIYVAGADPFAEDQLGDLQLSMGGLARRDRLVAEACRERGWPMATVMAGGYARDKHDTARIHAQTGVQMAKAWEIEPIENRA